MVALKLPQILRLDPQSEIVFKGPFEHVVTSYLELANPSEERVCFKVKTTAPRRYCVRPNCGIVQPGGKVKIAIMLQPMDSNSQAERNKHKFMVQSTIMRDETMTTDEIWQAKQPEEIMDSKLRCVFQEPQNEDGKGDAAEQELDKESVRSKQTSNSTTAQQKQPAHGDWPMQEQKAAHTSEPTNSMPASAQITSSTPKAAWTASSGAKATNQNPKRSDLSMTDKSLASSHNLSNSFLQQAVSDDYKIVLVSLAMLFLGVILGRYII